MQQTHTSDDAGKGIARRREQTTIFDCLLASPVFVDDGAARHLAGSNLATVALLSTTEGLVRLEDLATIGSTHGTLGWFFKPRGDFAGAWPKMKIILVLFIAWLGLTIHAGILVGPVVNPANGHIYYLLSQNSWSNAEAEAVSLGGHLATIRNADEQEWVFSAFSRYGGALWIGLTDRDKVFAFRWVSGEPLSYTNWGGGQPDNGTGGVEFYGHMWPAGSRSPAPGKWNDYGDADNVLSFPLHGVAEISPPATLRLGLHAAINTTKAEPNASSATAIGTSPELVACSALELSWSSDSNNLYQVQRTPSLDSPRWVNLEPMVFGTGTNLSVIVSTKGDLQGFYRLKIVQ